MTGILDMGTGQLWAHETLRKKYYSKTRRDKQLFLMKLIKQIKWGWSLFDGISDFVTALDWAGKDVSEEFLDSVFNVIYVVLEGLSKDGQS